MTFATSYPEEPPLTRAAIGATHDHARPLVLSGRLRYAAGIIGDLSAAVGIVLGIPFVILAVGTPIALCVRLLAWVGGWR